jgi:hypothetical protein
MMPCSVAVGYQGFARPCCLHLQGEDVVFCILTPWSVMVGHQGFRVPFCFHPQGDLIFIYWGHKPVVSKLMILRLHHCLRLESGSLNIHHIEATNSKKRSNFWEANSNSASQEFLLPSLLWNPKVHYRVHNTRPLIPFVGQVHPVYTFPPCFPKIHSILIIPSMPSSSEVSLPFRFPDRNILCISYLSHAWSPNRNMFQIKAIDRN